MKNRFFKFLAVFLSMFFLGLVSLFGQDVVFPKDENGKIVFTEVVQVENTVKDVLFARAQEWFANAFVSAQNVIQMQDKDAGKIVGKGSFSGINIDEDTLRGGNEGKIKFTISISVKDGRYKYEIYDLFHEGIFAPGKSIGGNKPASGGALENEKPECGKPSMGMGGLKEKEWKLIKAMAYQKINEMIASIKKSMATEPKKNDW